MTLLLVQVAVVLLTALLCGAIAQWLGQAKVVGEIAGGILLGPSAFGRLAPYAASSIFPSSSLGAFDILSTIGLVLFLFLIGAELNLEHLAHQRVTAILASASSVVLPMILTAVATPWLFAQCAPAGTPLIPFGLFLGISMSITAFPVLARILEERRIQGTSLGATALLCAAVDDVTAWFLLAFALTFLPSQSGTSSLWSRFLGLGLYLLVMVALVRPLGRWIVLRYPNLPFSYEILGLSVGFLLLSSATTNALGIHPLFGAFTAGLCFPRIPAWQKELRLRFDPLVSVLLLPVFFALTGLRTRLDLLNGASSWILGIVILGIAFAGKIGGAVAGARLTGQSWQNAFALGALMNTRGAGGAYCAEYCLQRACIFASALRFARGDGVGDHRDDHALARLRYEAKSRVAVSIRSSCLNRLFACTLSYHASRPKASQVIDSDIEHTGRSSRTSQQEARCRHRPFGSSSARIVTNHEGSLVSSQKSGRTL